MKNFSRALTVTVIFSSYCAGTFEPNTVIATIPVGVTPNGIAVTPDGKFAYVANNNNYGIANQDSVSVLDLATNTLADTIHDASFNEPYTITINQAGTKVYVTNSNSSTVSIIDTGTNTVSGVITGFDGPSGFVITPDGKTAYVNNYGGPGGVGSGNGTTVRVVSLSTNTIIGAPITVGLAPAALAMSLDGEFVYTINYTTGNPGAGTMSVIKTSTNTVVATISGFSGPFAIALTPDGNFAYVTNFGSNNFAPFGTTVTVVDLRKNSITATVDVGIQPSGVAVTPDGRFAYVSNYNTLYAGSGFTNLTAGQGTVNIIDTATNSVIPPVIAVDQSPATIAISADGAFAYVTNYTSNTVNVIALPTFQITAQGCSFRNIFLNRIEFINKLTWETTGTSLPIRYSIYRDAGLTQLVATVPATQSLQLFDRLMASSASTTYYIVGTNAAGTTSLPLPINITQSC